MEDPGHLLAMSFLLLYSILGPLVLFALYVLFDFFARHGKPEEDRQDKDDSPRHPAVWTDEDLNRFMRQS